jgi:outer membrane protein OmpA-like peptidoglycan-associated protein
MTRLDSTIGPAELAAIARVDVLSEDRRIDWGTAFLIARRHAITALHVVAKEKVPNPKPRTDHLRLVFANARLVAGTSSASELFERRVHLVAEHANADTDWALLEFDPDQEDLWRIDPLLMHAAALPFASPFQSFGFARINPSDGIALSGHVENAEALAGGTAAVQLFSAQVAAAEARVAGQSGAPVFSNGAVVGLVRSFIERDGMAVAGTLYATPASAPLADPFVRSIARTDPCVGVPALSENEALPTEPFRYLERYHRDDASLFFGRCRDLKLIARALEGERRVILLYGQSGVGKSSLLAAGIEQRLRRSYDIRIVRRTRERGLAGDLAHGLGIPRGSAAEFETAWVNLEAASGPPLRTAERTRSMLVILDQVEEAWTRPRNSDAVAEAGSAPASEIDELLALLSNHYAVGHASTRILLSFRKDWLSEIDSALQRWGLSSAGLRIAPLDFDAIEEIVLSIPRTPRLANAYGLTVEPQLARRIASDLTRDVGSAIAPALRVVLTNLWREARARDREHPSFDVRLYEMLAARGLGLDRFLDERLNELTREMRDDAESGLALDLLEFHTTALATSEQRDDCELQDQYRERPDRARRLREALKDVYLLVDAVEAGDSGGKTRLAHDMLAPLVRARFAASHQSGPRARRILETRTADLQTGPPRVLDRQDLRQVERGLSAMRRLTSVEAELVARSQRTRRRGTVIRSLMAFGAAGSVVAGLALGTMVSRSRSAVVSAEAAVLSAELARRRLEKAAACGCAIVRIDDVPGLTATSIFQVTEPRLYEDSDETATDAAAHAGFPDSKTSYQVDWIGKEALLPPGTYVLEYSVRDRDAAMMIHSKGVGHDFVVTPPAPEQREGFQFVGGGDCGNDGARVPPFFLVRDVNPGTVTWAVAKAAALRQHGRLPARDEIVCATKLGLLEYADDVWSWTFETSDSDKRGYFVVRNTVTRTGLANGLALGHVVRPVIARGVERVVRTMTMDGSPDSAASSQMTTAPVTAADVRRDFEDLLLAIAEAQPTSIVLKGAYCSSWKLRDELADAGVSAASIQVEAIALEPDDGSSESSGTSLNAGIVVVQLGNATSRLPRDRDLTKFERQCPSGKVVVMDTTIEVLDDVGFRPGTATMSKSDDRILQAVAASLQGNPSIELMEIGGHVFEGPHSLRQKLSDLRAERVLKFLVRAGVARSRLVSAGYGDRRPTGCTRELATLVNRHTSINEMRASNAWHSAAETNYLLGKLSTFCKSISPWNTRISFEILKRSTD